MLACSRCRVEYTTPLARCGLCGAPLAELAEDPLIGARLGPYRVTSRLGAGGSGVVYRARHEALDREHAVKVLYGQHSSNTKSSERFRREARALARLSDPHVVAVVDYGQMRSVGPDGSEGEPLELIAMELLDGETLRERLARGPMPREQALSIARQLASGLDAAHKAGLVHRDLKPANVMLSRDGARAKVLDFGLVALLDRGSEGGDLTSDAVAIGTPAYMAPEQLHYSGVDERADLYALGCILHHMLAGAPPFAGSRGELLHAHAHTPPPPLPPLGGLESLVAWLLEKDPSMRPPSAREVLEELERISEGAPTVARPSRRRWLLALPAVALALLWISSLRGTTPGAATEPPAASASSAAGGPSPAESSSVAQAASATTAPSRGGPALAPSPAGPVPTRTPPRVRALGPAPRSPEAREPRPPAPVAAAEAPAPVVAEVAPAPVVAEVAPALASDVEASPVPETPSIPLESPAGLGWADVVVTQGGRMRAASVRVDGVPVSRRTPLRLSLPSGAHVIEVDAGGGASSRRAIEVSAGAGSNVAFEL